MQIIHGDILTRSEQGSKTLWINQRLISETCNLSEEYLWKIRSLYKQSLPPSHQNFDILPDNGKAWRWAKMNGAFYYALNRIPNRAPKYYRDMLPTEDELFRLMDTMQVRTKGEAVEFIKREIAGKVNEFLKSDDVQYFKYESEPSFTQDKAVQLAESKAWCQLIYTFINSGKYRTLGVNRKEHFYQLCTDIISPLRLEGLHIKTAKSLRKKLHYFPALDELAQRQYLASSKYGNQNARKIGKFKLVDTITGEILDFDIHEAIMFNLYMNPGQPQKEELLPLWEDYKETLAEFTVEPAMAYRTFCQYCSRFDTDLATAKARHGKDYYSKHYLTYVPSEPLKYAHSLFAGDGSATVAYKYYDKDGKCCRMNLYVILISDVASRNIAGWAPAREGMHNETPRMVEQAVKMAVKAGGYQTMFEIVTDNHGAFTGAESVELLSGIFNKVRTIRPGNSQANPAETQFRLFKKTLKRFDNFLRSSWNGGINSQANPDFIPNNDALPTYEEAIIQMGKIIEAYNRKQLRDGSTSIQRFSNKHPECKPMDPRQLRSVFGHKTKVDVSYMRGFVQVWKGDQLFKFEIPDYMVSASTIAKATGYKPDAQVWVRWDETGADLYNQEGKYIMSCNPTKKAVQSQAESNEGTDYAIGHHEKRQRIQEETADRFERKISEAAALIHTGNVEAYNIAVTDRNFSKETYNATMEETVNSNEVAYSIPAIKNNSLKRKRVEISPDEAAFDKL